MYSRYFFKLMSLYGLKVMGKHTLLSDDEKTKRNTDRPTDLERASYSISEIRVHIAVSAFICGGGTPFRYTQ